MSPTFRATLWQKLEETEELEEAQIKLLRYWQTAS